MSFTIAALLSNSSTNQNKSAKRQTISQQLGELERITRAPGSDKKRDIGQTLKDVVHMLTGKTPTCLKQTENPNAVPLTEEEKLDIKAVKKSKEQNRRDRHAEMFQELKDFILRNNLLVSKRHEKLERLTIINLIIDYIKEKRVPSPPETSPNSTPSTSGALTPALPTDLPFFMPMEQQFPVVPVYDQQFLIAQYFAMLQQSFQNALLQGVNNIGNNQ